VRRGATEDLVAKLDDYERSDLPERTKMALRLADRLSVGHEPVDPAFYARLREHFSDDQILDLGMCIAFASGWQRFIEAFGVMPDGWGDGDPLPWPDAGWDDGEEARAAGDPVSPGGDAG
jgi:alkylhydroperoxidase family enzyme